MKQACSQQSLSRRLNVRTATLVPPRPPQALDAPRLRRARRRTREEAPRRGFSAMTRRCGERGNLAFGRSSPRHPGSRRSGHPGPPRFRSSRHREHVGRRHVARGPGPLSPRSAFAGRRSDRHRRRAYPASLASREGRAMIPASNSEAISASGRRATSPSISSVCSPSSGAGRASSRARPAKVIGEDGLR